MEKKPKRLIQWQIICIPQHFLSTPKIKKFDTRKIFQIFNINLMGTTLNRKKTNISNSLISETHEQKLRDFKKNHQKKLNFMCYHEKKYLA